MYMKALKLRGGASPFASCSVSSSTSRIVFYSGLEGESFKAAIARRKLFASNLQTFVHAALIYFCMNVVNLFFQWVISKMTRISQKANDASAYRSLLVAALSVNYVQTLAVSGEELAMQLTVSVANNTDQDILLKSIQKATFISTLIIPKNVVVSYFNQKYINTTNNGNMHENQ